MTGTPAQRPTCPRCGTRWVQRGDLTGHCPACHRTFSSVSGFDRHQHLDDAGRVVCMDPATLLRADGTPRFTTFRDEAGALVWRRLDRSPNPYVTTVPAPRASEENTMTDHRSSGSAGAATVETAGVSA